MSSFRSTTVHFLVLTAVCMAWCFAGCDSSPSLNEETAGTCDLTTDPEQVFVPLTVTYRAAGSGNVSFSSVTYRTAEGTQTVNNPDLPFERTVTLSVGATVQIEGTAVVEGGTATIRYSGSGRQGDASQTLVDSQQCGNSSASAR